MPSSDVLNDANPQFFSITFAFKLNGKYSIITVKQLKREYFDYIRTHIVQALHPALIFRTTNPMNLPFMLMLSTLDIFASAITC